MIAPFGNQDVIGGMVYLGGGGFAGTVIQKQTPESTGNDWGFGVYGDWHMPVVLDEGAMDPCCLYIWGTPGGPGLCPNTPQWGLAHEMLHSFQNPDLCFDPVPTGFVDMDDWTGECAEDTWDHMHNPPAGCCDDTWTADQKAELTSSRLDTFID